MLVEIPDTMPCQILIMGCNRVLAVVVMVLALGCVEGAAIELPNPLFAMDTGTQDATHKTPAEQVALVKEIGFAGSARPITTPLSFSNGSSHLTRTG